MTAFSPLQHQVLAAMGIPLWQRPQPPAAPLTLIDDSDDLASSRLLAAVCALLAIHPAQVVKAATAPAAGRCWLISSQCAAPRLDGERLITPPWPQLTTAAAKRQLWRLLQQWLPANDV
ncbi:MAG: hypothetical protein II007_09550 [Gammaproteobacteria bacterium]|nr:hypothetical protein [Gammaproteobacteria bacterium]